MRIHAWVAVLLTFVSFASAEEFDLIIRHGRVVDGSGNPSFAADVAVRAGHIVRIGRVDGTAKTEIDATGLIVAPGFIDVHTHADEVADQPLAENFLRMGVTSIVVGNCGGSALDVGKFYRDVERNQVSINVTTLIGHNTVREAAMGGSFDRAPTAEEMAKMKAIVDRAMQDGAVGLSTGLIYLPGTFAKTDEIVELAKAVTPYGGIYASHMRHEDTRIYAALDEVFRVAREAHLRAEVSHLKLSGERAWGQADKVLAYIEAARASGLDITEDQYAYTASSTTMRQLIPDDAFDGGHEHFLAVLADPVKKADLVARMKKNIMTRGRQDYAYAVVASFRHDSSINGMNILEAAKKLKGSDSLDAQIEVILDLEKNGSAQGVFHGMNEEDLQKFMRHPNTMIASDSGLREFGKDVPHPRGYGNNARVLGHYVRDLKVLLLEDAIRKMTSLPAATFHFAQRGELREGNWADIAVFDSEKIGDPATYADPHHYAVGLPYVLVNGVPVIANGEHTGAKPGMACRANGSGLAALLETFVTQPRFAGAIWSVQVRSLDSGRILFAHEADRRMSPASNSKLYTGALALDLLGGDYRIRTPLRSTARPNAGGVLAGDLIIAGRGDPSWDHRTGKKDFWSTFEPFVAALQKAGVKRITGDLVADATWLRQPPAGASWTADDMDYDYGAEISAVTLADNYVDLRITPAAAAGQPCAVEVLQPGSGLVVDNRTVTGPTGSAREIRVQRLPGEDTVHLTGTLPLGGKVEETEAPVPRPAQWFAIALREALQKAGIAVDGRARSVRWPDAPATGEVLLGEVTSAPLRDLVARFMLPSQNLETDLIFSHVGEQRRTAATPVWLQSDELAVTALKEFMTRVGVPAGAVLFDEGSGLSRNNLTTAEATTDLLAYMAKHREAAAFYASLPTAGVDGSLKKRMVGTAAENNVHAKTGTLRWANSLSGYVTTAGGEKLAFSFMLNRHVAPADRKTIAELDELAVMLAHYGQP
ncbi:MAG: D-alanyl-D-alanine carboxypeptidase/D-alanyl-D-alanine-endopeptidase [Lacunisphaera sp.]|nr:D-alanyl-D-alanine carboxypeptidase/D-alanyl-D-alanine-endopeptidase [Lacunisphaera sp.]